MAAHALRIAFTLGIVPCLQNAASADLVIKFYLDNGGVWMSLNGTGETTNGTGSTSTYNFNDFGGNPFPFTSPPSVDIMLSDSTLQITGGANSRDITSVTLNGQGNNASDVTLDWSPP